MVTRHTSYVSPAIRETGIGNGSAICAISPDGYNSDDLGGYGNGGSLHQQCKHKYIQYQRRNHQSLFGCQWWCSISWCYQCKSHPFRQCCYQLPGNAAERIGSQHNRRTVFKCIRCNEIISRLRMYSEPLVLMFRQGKSIFLQKNQKKFKDFLQE